MTKQIYIINGSPRKNWNTSKMCESFAKGVIDAGGYAEIINLYDIFLIPTLGYVEYDRNI